MKVDSLAAQIRSLQGKPEPARGPAPGRPSAQPADPGAAAPADAEPRKGDGAPAVAPVGSGFRSPATVNAARRFAERALDGLEGETREQAEEAVAALIELAQKIAAEDPRPYGRSLEHTIKKLFNEAAIRDALQFAISEPPISEPSEPVPADPTAAEVPYTTPGDVLNLEA